MRRVIHYDYILKNQKNKKMSKKKTNKKENKDLEKEKSTLRQHVSNLWYIIRNGSAEDKELAEKELKEIINEEE